MVAGQVFFGHAGEILPAYGVAFAGEGGASYQAQVYGEVAPSGEVYEDVEGAGDALAVAGQVAGPGLFHAAAPGGVVAQADQGRVARVALVELEGEVVGPAVGEAFDEGCRGALGLCLILQQDEGPCVVLLGELVECGRAGRYGVLDGPEEHSGGDA